jgi:hypothetical protein
VETVMNILEDPTASPEMEAIGSDQHLKTGHFRTQHFNNKSSSVICLESLMEYFEE